MVPIIYIYFFTLSFVESYLNITIKKRNIAQKIKKSKNRINHLVYILLYVDGKAGF